jgi:DNA-binding CsgD family transcriptional regulator
VAVFAQSEILIAFFWRKSALGNALVSRTTCPTPLEVSVVNARSYRCAEQPFPFKKELRLSAADPIREREVPASVAGQLIAAMGAIGDSQPNLSERRRAILHLLAELVQADSGFWSWGRGKPDATAVAPLAIIDFGLTHQQRAAVIEWGLDERTDTEFRQPIMQKLKTANSSTDTRGDLFSDDQWDQFPHMRKQLALAGWGTWLHSVRYSAADTWSNLFLLRNVGRDEFGLTEAAVVDLALSGIPWLHSTADEYLPPEAFAGLTPRQRTVMLLLLDGLPRKTIAQQLGITEDTVGDHLKSIYSHFAVNSAGELAAKFLRNR